MNEDLKRVKAVLREKVILLGMSRTRPEQLASDSGPLVAADVLVAKVQTTKRKKRRITKRMRMTRKRMKLLGVKPAARLARLAASQSERREVDGNRRAKPGFGQFER